MSGGVSLVREDRRSNGTFRWLDGHSERVRVVGRPWQHPDEQCERVPVSWPESVRTMNGVGTVRRPTGSVPVDRLRMDRDGGGTGVCRVSPSGVEHLVFRNCATCGNGAHTDWPVAS